MGRDCGIRRCRHRRPGRRWVRLDVGVRAVGEPRRRPPGRVARRVGQSVVDGREHLPGRRRAATRWEQPSGQLRVEGGETPEGVHHLGPGPHRLGTVDPPGDHPRAGWAATVAGTLRTGRLTPRRPRRRSGHGDDRVEVDLPPRNTVTAPRVEPGRARPAPRESTRAARSTDRRTAARIRATGVGRAGPDVAYCAPAAARRRRSSSTRPTAGRGLVAAMIQCLRRRG